MEYTLKGVICKAFVFGMQENSMEEFSALKINQIFSDPKLNHKKYHILKSVISIYGHE
ncbi:MAG: hypothetical protein Q7S33_04135 [Nanoarchaeota archaeon]|nr:hypothetical protein [Nanoarchaeota archaeon]